MTVVIAPVTEEVEVESVSANPASVEPVVEVVIRPSVESGPRSDAHVRFVAVPAGA